MWNNAQKNQVIQMYVQNIVIYALTTLTNIFWSTLTVAFTSAFVQLHFFRAVLVYLHCPPQSVSQYLCSN